MMMMMMVSVGRIIQLVPLRLSPSLLRSSENIFFASRRMQPVSLFFAVRRSSEGQRSKDESADHIIELRVYHWNFAPVKKKRSEVIREDQRGRPWCAPPVSSPIHIFAVLEAVARDHQTPRSIISNFLVDFFLFSSRARALLSRRFIITKSSHVNGELALYVDLFLFWQVATTSSHFRSTPIISYWDYGCESDSLTSTQPSMGLGKTMVLRVFLPVSRMLQFFSVFVIFLCLFCVYEKEWKIIRPVFTSENTHNPGGDGRRSNV